MKISLQQVTNEPLFEELYNSLEKCRKILNNEEQFKSRMPDSIKGELIVFQGSEEGKIIWNIAKVFWNGSDNEFDCLLTAVGQILGTGSAEYKILDGTIDKLRGYNREKIVDESKPLENKGRSSLIRFMKKEINDRHEIFEDRERLGHSVKDISLESKPEFLYKFIPSDSHNYQDKEKPQDVKQLLDQLFNSSEPQRMLILGEPASGKSTVLFKIAKEFLKRAENDPDMPVPIYLSLKSWEGGPLRKWLKKESNRNYHTSLNEKNWLERIINKIIGNKLYARLFDGNEEHPIEPGKLFLLLDHFELVKKGENEKLIEALSECNSSNIILCSTIEAFEHYISTEGEEPTNKLPDFDEAFLLKPLTKEQINKYLDSFQESDNSSLNELKSLFSSNKNLRKITRSLFILGIVVNLVIRKKIKEENIRNLDDTNMLSYVLKKYVESKFEDVEYCSKHPTQKQCSSFSVNPPYWKFIKPKSKTYLKWLAQAMCGSSADGSKRPDPLFFLEEIQPILLENKNIHRFGSIFFAGLLSFLVGTLHLLIQPIDGWKYTFLTGVPGGIFIVFFYIIDGAEIKPAEKLTWSFKTIRENALKALFMFPISLGVGFLCSFLESIKVVELYEKGFERVIGGELNEFSLGLFYTGFITVMITLLYSLTAEISSYKVKRIEVNQGIWTSSHNAIVIGFVVFLFSSVIFWLLGLLVQKHPLILATRFGVGYGMIAGLLFAIGCSGGRASIKHFTLRFILFKQKKIPWNFSKFLEFGVNDLKLLQRAGGKLLFVNSEIRKYFAMSTDG